MLYVYLFTFVGSSLDDLMSRPFRLEEVLSAPIARDAEPCMNQVRFQPLKNSAYVQRSKLDPGEADSLRLCAWNCHLTTGYEDVLQFLSDSQGKISFIGISESFFSQEHSFSLYSFPDYNLEAKNRTSLHRGGIACLISKSLTYQVRNDIDVWIEGKFESFSIDLNLGSSKFLISIVYKPPSASWEDFERGFDQLTRAVSRTGLDFICMGDFNFDLLSLNGVNLDFFNLMVANDLFPLANIPTRVTSHSATLIDNIFVGSKYLDRSYADVVLYPCSDHFPVLGTVPCVRIKRNERKKVKTRSLKKENLQRFGDELSSTDLSEILEIKDDASGAFDCMMGIIQPIYDKTCPVKFVKPHKDQPRKPWITTEILEASHLRNQVYVDYLNSRCVKKLEEFKIIRNKVNSMRRKAKKEYFANQLSLNKDNARGTWKVINDLLGKKKEAPPNSLLIQGEAVSDETIITNKFAEFFSSIGQNVQAEGLVNFNNDSLEDEFLDERGIGNEIEFQPCTGDEILKVVKTIKSNSAGTDGINLKAFKSVMCYLIPCLVHIINLSLETGVFPDALKRAKVIPLHKGGSKLDIENYRPISILPLFSKIFEKIVHKRLYDYLTKTGMLSETQFGFRKGHSTSDAVHSLCDIVNRCFERGEIPLTVFIDFRKAFDTVDFKILLKRLQSLGVRGNYLKWFDSFLSGRSIQVVLNDAFSSPYQVKCGVPQGSVLGPLLYLVYVDSMRFYLPECFITTFADDTALTMSSRMIDDLLLKVNRVLKSFYVFTSLSLLSVNVKKTNFMIFRRVGKPPSVDGEIFFNGKPLSQVHEVRYLGFQLDCNLSWKHHSDLVAAKVARGLGILRRLKHFLPLSVLLLLYHSIVAPYISYGCVIWSSNFYANFKRVQILQNKTVRLLGNYIENVNDTASCFKKLRVLNIGQIRDYQAAIFAYRCWNDVCPPVFTNFFRVNSSLHRYATREAENFTVEYRDTTRAGFGIRYLAPAIWNDIPVGVREAEHIGSFKVKIKKHLLGEGR